MTDNAMPLGGQDEGAHSAVITPKGVAWTLTGIGLLALLPHIGVLVMKHVFGKPYLGGMANMFHLNEEHNVPTLIAVFLLMTCAAALAYTASTLPAKSRDRAGWLVMALVFAFMAFDESVQIHELTSQPINDMFNAEILQPFGWVLPYGFALIVLGLVLAPWFFRLDRASQIRFIIAGTIFVGGALGIEIIEGAHYRSLGEELNPELYTKVNQTLAHDLLWTLQESMEYIGAGYFLYAIIKRLGGIQMAPAIR
ncbi:hypothetical protein [Hyphomonas pacifica]|uniref:Uncharacterized protein n=1 Tax=Hyphomonas pacifica TaxID=1280941 RepID=A0A062TVY1_9PROT|nr:hypothetical protein [Hyphomonas pacifica]KCZ49455.1 hypothetical protein HY2_03450 [Hyphomonas pacifica]MBR9806140.1 hypothetical protein [Alphaproteobacteria bacterium]RAN32990.1 hypothetical protein HY11_04675 [Hyphomonas pacifica]RAN33261.1 hypothetical protein HY3_02610 [Hyphomonas pacifica]